MSLESQRTGGAVNERKGAGKEISWTITQKRHVG